MSIKRSGVLSASLVCSVLSTRWPVSAARRPISAVVWSRISPIRITSGSCRSAARSTRWKLRSILSITCTWFRPGRRYSIGSSTVMILRSVSFSAFSAAYSVVVLPLPVGPVTTNIPLGRFSVRATAAATSGGRPRWSSESRPALWLSSRITTDSPCWVGRVLMRTSMLPSLSRTWKRPSCGRRFSLMSSPLINFSRSATAPAILASASVCTCSTPSMRKRMRRLRSCGSMWMSDARLRSACSNIELSRRTTGASSVVTWPRPSRSPISSSTVAMSAVNSRARPAISSPPR